MPHTKLNRPTIRDQLPIASETPSQLQRKYQQLKYPLPDDLILPEPLRNKPSGEHAWYWRYRGKSWPRDLKALTLMATSGWSSRLALSYWLVDHEPTVNSITSGSIKRLWQRLTYLLDYDMGLVGHQNVVIDRSHNFQVSVVWLTEVARELLVEIGVPWTVSEWDRMRLLHNGPNQPKHTAMVILAAHLFRQRGFYTVVCPVVEARLRPDLMLVDPHTGRRLYVEVEAPRHTGKAKREQLKRKWELVLELQDSIIICALNPRQRAQRVNSAKRVAEHGLATDLRTLSHNPDILWTHAWGKHA